MQFLSISVCTQIIQVSTVLHFTGCDFHIAKKRNLLYGSIVWFTCIPVFKFLLIEKRSWAAVEQSQWSLIWAIFTHAVHLWTYLPQNQPTERHVRCRYPDNNMSPTFYILKERSVCGMVRKVLAIAQWIHNHTLASGLLPSAIFKILLWVFY